MEELVFCADKIMVMDNLKNLRVFNFVILLNRENCKNFMLVKYTFYSTSFWKFSKLSNGGISLNWSIIDEITTCNTTTYFFGPLCTWTEG